MQSICVFCGSSDRVGAHYFEAAREMGAVIARRGFRLIYGAGSTGLMGALANAALENRGEVVGVLPEIFNSPHLVHNQLTRLEILPDLHQRKARMIALADAFIALPGGYGTLDELFETLTWAQIGLHRKPIGLLDVQSYFQPLFGVIQHMQAQGFIYRQHRDLLRIHPDPQQLLDALASYRPPDGLEEWMTRSLEE